MIVLLVGLITFVLGIILLIYYPIHSAQNKRRSKRIEGTVTAIDQRTVRRKQAGTGRYRKTTYYKYDVGYNVSGQQFSIRSSETQLKYDEGRSLTVCYNPDNPQDAHIVEIHGESSKVVLYVGLVCIAVTLVCVLIFML